MDVLRIAGCAFDGRIAACCAETGIDQDQLWSAKIERHARLDQRKITKQQRINLALRAAIPPVAPQPIQPLKIAGVISLAGAEPHGKPVAVGIRNQDAVISNLGPRRVLRRQN
ncbi:hypothetical protein VWY41_01745 [Phaeobacter sp. JH20_18]